MPHVDYECAGLVFRSTVPLAAPLAIGAASGTATEASKIVIVEVGAPKPIPFKRPSPEVIAEVVRDNAVWSTTCRTSHGYVARYFGVCDFVISAKLDRVTCIPNDEGRIGLIPILLTGAITAVLLVLRGACVLHASAVEIGGSAYAFVGPTGQGKTTVAALLTANGAPLITDDVLPIEFDEKENDSRVFAVRAIHELRLRPKAQSLIDFYAHDIRQRFTADDRYAIAPATSTKARLPIAAIALPLPDRDCDVVTARRLDSGNAAFSLGRSNRVDGLVDLDAIKRHFTDVARIASATPIFELSIPWGPPFDKDLANQIVAALGGATVRA